jgi:cell shape-determining protein MreC
MLPPGVPIGTVTVCRPRRDNPLLYEIEVTPLAALGALDAVLVVEMGAAPQQGQ